MGSCDVPPIRAEVSRTITGIIEMGRIALAQKLSRPVSHVPQSDSVIIGRDERSAIRREVEGVDGTGVFFERIPYKFCAYFPNLERRQVGAQLLGGEEAYIDASI
jgi:hypothetical protein